MIADPFSVINGILNDKITSIAAKFVIFDKPLAILRLIRHTIYEKTSLARSLRNGLLSDASQPIKPTFWRDSSQPL